MFFLIKSKSDKGFNWPQLTFMKHQSYNIEYCGTNNDFFDYITKNMSLLKSVPTATFAIDARPDDFEKVIPQNQTPI